MREPNQPRYLRSSDAARRYKRKRRKIVLRRLAALLVFCGIIVGGVILYLSLAGDEGDATAGIAAGVFRLGRLRVHNPWNDHYGSVMKFLKLMAVLALIEAGAGHVVLPTSAALAVFPSVVRLAQVAGVFLLCMAVRWLCRAAGLRRSARLWQGVTFALVGLFCGPLAMYYAAEFWSRMAGSDAGLPPGPWRAGVSAVLAAPFAAVWLFSFRLEAEAAAARPETNPPDWTARLRP